MPSPLVEVSNVAKSFGAFQAVSDVSFTVSPGEVVGLLGVNGAGKTTMMSMLLGLITPDSGSIRILPSTA
jgi:ABC-type multidrug transport system ATPase subunit